jgi:hypothetical protein
MQSVKYQLRLKGLSTPDGTISVRVLKDVLQQLTSFAERGLRLAIEGQSVKRGTVPSWIEKSTEMTITGLETGSTILDIEAPVLGDTIGEQINQQDFWVSPPARTDTAFTLVSKSIKDATGENLESEYYDGGLLGTLLGLKPFVLGEMQSLELHALDRPQEDFTLTRESIEKAEQLQVRTPEAQAFIVSGHLDEIRHSRKQFQLVVEDGQIIRGRVNEDFMSAEQMRDLWGKKVSVKGMVYFKPSGAVRMLDAHMLKPMEAGEEVFGMIPAIQTEAGFVHAITAQSEQRNWLKNIWDQWPGDESIEELLAELER